jgi:hypothetical protein
MSLRRVGRSWAVLVGLGGAAGWLGCNALAGIELGTLAPTDGGDKDGTVLADVGAGSGSSDSAAKMESGATDAGSGSSGDGGEAGNGVDAGAPMFVCSPSPRPFAVANLENVPDGGSRQFANNGGGLALGVTSDQEARIVLQVGQGGSNEEFRVYNVRWPGSLDSVWTFTGNSWLISAQLTPTGITALLGTPVFLDGGGSLTTLQAWPIPANIRDQSSLPSPYPLTVPLPIFNGQANLLELGMEDDFVLTRPQVGTGSSLGSTRASRTGGPGTPSTFATFTDQHGDSPLLVPGGGSVYAVVGSDPTSDAGVNIYKLPSSGQNSGPVTPSTLPPSTLIAGAFPSTSDTTKIATFAATLVMVPAPELTFYAGLVDTARFDAVQLSALTQGASFGLHEVPVNKSSVAFAGDELAMAGLSPVASDQGINFVWMDSNARVLGKAVGDTRLYHDRVGIQSTAIAVVQNIGILASFYVAWIEEPSDAAGIYDVLYVDQVQCAPP